MTYSISGYFVTLLHIASSFPPWIVFVVDGGILTVIVAGDGTDESEV